VSDAESPERARWSRVTDLFSRTLELPPEARAAFVREASSDDEALATEVLSLIAAHERAGDFIARPASADVVPDAAGIETGMPLAPGQLMGHYRIAGLIGEGGMGVVYLAEDRRLGRAVALKAITPALAGDPTRAARLRREARAAAALNHPDIATVYALEEIDGRLFIASEYVPGETLRDELARGPVSRPRARETIAAIARALAAAHDRGIVHRDLKPENVVRTPDGRVKILDFGLAQFTDADDPSVDLTGDGGAIGTPAYMSPEQIRGAPIDRRSDVFALGVLAYELLTGMHPFAAGTPAATLARILEAEPLPLAPSGGATAASDSVADRLDVIVRRCLRKAPDDRYQAAGDVADALERMATSDAAAMTHASSGPAGRNATWWWEFHQAAATAAYVLLLIPLWRIRHVPPGGPGTWLFLAAVIAVVVASATRLHLWFAARLDRATWRDQQLRTRRWTMGADLIFGLVLAAGGLLAVDADAASAMLLVAAAAGVVVSAVIIEPATARAAGGPTSS
jgi:predicted Ser/Thr protein kinase